MFPSHDQVEDYLKNTDPDRIGYFAFTKKAANETKSRAMDKFNYSEDDLPYFRTMHSLAFRRLGVNKDQVMQRRHYEDLGRKLNLFIDYNEYDEEETGLFTTKSDYLRIINLAKLRNITLDQQVKLGDHTTEIDYDTLMHLSNELTRYKKENNLFPSHDPCVKESVVLSQIVFAMFHCIIDRSCASSINTTSNLGDLSDFINSKIISL